MLSKIIESLYLKVFINIIVKSTSTVVYVEVHSRKDLVDSAQVKFNTKVLNEELLEFITNYTKDSPYYYISILDTSALQGALPTCAKDKLSYYYDDLGSCEYKCYNGKWGYFTSKTEIYEIEKAYHQIGIDFIFSPFVILANFFKDKIDSKLALYALVYENFISIAIFENSQLLYAEYLDMEANDSDDIVLSNDLEDESFDLEMDDGIDLESIDVDDDVTELEDFSDIEDLDSIEELDEFDDSKDISDQLLEDDDMSSEVDDDTINEDYQRFSLIQSSIARFYKDDRYESQFLENIYIADGVGVSSDLKKYLEEEMFLNVYIRHTEIDVELCELAKEEI